ncbi:MAG: glycoside hydrolase family 13 protein [Lachnospiraceae bacterium]|nr:glycoside hydrolase family 13 protein [Lachnospiraceae bacterium]
MNREAIFSDGTREFLDPWEVRPGQRVAIRVRTSRYDSLKAVLLTEKEPIEMRLDEENGAFSFYKTTVSMGESPFRYIFSITDGVETLYFDRYGVAEEQRWQYAFIIVPGFYTPSWAKGAVMYQILVDRFCSGDDSNDVVDREYHYINSYAGKIPDWNRPPSDFDVCNFYGGDLEGVRSKLNYLKSLGVEVIYFNPIFVSPSNHKYDTQDYDYIDPHYGRIINDGGEPLKEGDTDNSHATKYKKRVTDIENLEASNELFAQLVSEAHEKGIRVILDGVFNHCGSFNKWLDREGIYENAVGFEPGAYHTADSPYVDFFDFHMNGKWPNNNAYDGWWGHDTLPKLNYEGSIRLMEYILSIGRKWVSPPYNADGWRLDVAADLGHSETFNHTFWKRFRDEVKSANPEAIILAEHYGDATPWLQGDQWDTIMNYDAFMEPVSYFLTGMEKHSDRFDEGAICNGEQFELTMRHTMAQFLTPSLHCSMNQLSNHDHSRFLTRTNHKVGRVAQLGSEAASEGVNVAVLKEATMIQMTWPGAPTLYYGDEAGVCGFTDPDNRRTYPWDNPDHDLIDFNRDMIMLHKVNSCLRTGSFVFLRCSRNLISYGRFSRDQQIVVVINGSGADLPCEIPVWKANVPMECEMEQILMTNELGYSIMPVKWKVEEGMLRMNLKPYTGIVLRRNR